MSTPMIFKPLRGHPEACGLIFDEALLDHETVRARVMALWSPSARLYRLSPLPGEPADRNRWWLSWPGHVRLPARGAPGAVVVRGRGVSLAVDLPESEHGAIARRGQLALAVGGRLHVWRVPRGQDQSEGLQATLFDISLWLDVEMFRLVEVRPLGLPPPPPEVIIETPPEVRGLFGGTIPSADPRRAQVERALSGEPLPDTPSRGLGGWLRGLFKGRSAPAKPQPESSSGAFDTTDLAVPHRRQGWLSRLLGAFGGDMRRTPKPDEGERWMPDGPDRGPSAGERLKARLMQRLLKMGLGNRALAEQVNYLNEMVEMFDRGQFDEALRRAIPLGKGEGGEGLGWTPGLPDRRDDLQISLQRASGGGSSLHMGRGGYARIRQMYRQAFERLDEQGEIDRAAFVLAELLGESEEAVAYLERHERFRLAAQLAEARGLKAPLIMRQWMLAGDVERVIWLARRHGAFEEAVQQLEGDHPAKARALRGVWAMHLARTGALGRAVAVGWPLLKVAPKVELKRVLETCIDQLIEQGGAKGASMLGIQIRRLSDGRALPSMALRARVEALMAEAEDDPDVDQTLSALLDGLTGSGDLMGFPGLRDAGPGEQSLIRALIRRLLPSHAQRTGQRSLKQLARRNHDPIFKVDFQGASIPTTPKNPLLPANGGMPLHLTFRDEGGTALAVDVALLDNGFAVALGEGGLWLTDRSGRPHTRVPHPAEVLVISDDRTRLLALARRGDVWRVTRVNIIDGAAEAWGEIKLQAFADTFDGDRWLVATDTQVMALDVFEHRFTALWKVESEGIVTGFARTTNMCVWRVEHGESAQVWQIETPSMTLRRRHTVGHELGALSVRGTGMSLTWSEKQKVCAIFPDGRRFAHPGTEAMWPDLEDTSSTSSSWQTPLFHGGQWWLYPRRDDRSQLEIYCNGVVSPRARFIFEGEGVPRVRAFRERILALGPQGQLLSLDPETGRHRIVHIKA
ncbi:MAG: bpX6 domain-containing protein [Bradymonadia bacterium]